MRIHTIPSCSLHIRGTFLNHPEFSSRGTYQTNSSGGENGRSDQAGNQERHEGEEKKKGSIEEKMKEVED